MARSHINIRKKEFHPQRSVKLKMRDCILLGVEDSTSLNWVGGVYVSSLPYLVAPKKILA